MEGVVHQVSGSLPRSSYLAAQGQTFCVQDPGFLTCRAQTTYSYF